MARVLPLVCLLAVACLALMSGCDASYPVVAPHGQELYKSKCSTEYDYNTGNPHKYPGWGYHGYYPGWGHHGYPGWGYHGYPGWGYHGYPSYGYHGYPSYGYHGYPSYGYAHGHGHGHGRW